MYTITKEFAFEASHRLIGLPEGHKCGNDHGHGYRVVVRLRAPRLNEVGFVVDYGELKPLKDYIDEKFDHQFLNNVVPFQTSAENLAKHFFDYCSALWPQTISVAVSETAKTWAKYTDRVSYDAHVFTTQPSGVP